MTDTVSRFSDRVANYVKYRPHYPAEVIAHLRNTCGLTAAMAVADIGCGTGISSKPFLENGNLVYGVEPNAAMREAAAEYLCEFGNFRIVDGTSAATGLPDQSVDLVFAGQAFHWFEPASARIEFKRILRPGGHIVLAWNERRLDADAFHVEYEDLLLRYGKDYQNVRHENVDQERLGDFFQQNYSAATFPNHQDFDLDGLRGRMLSSSYMPNEADDVYPTMIKDLQTLFAKHTENGRIRVLYDTNVYISSV